MRGEASRPVPVEDRVKAFLRRHPECGYDSLDDLASALLLVWARDHGIEP